MSNWIAPPEPMEFLLPKPLMAGGMKYTQVTVGAPTTEDVLKATAVKGAAGLDVTLRMVESASAEQVPYEVLKKQPHWFNQQVADYFEEFLGVPAPDPLESWRSARRVALRAQVLAEEAEAAAAAKALAEANAAISAAPAS
jgi:hypothetical protein